VAEQHTQVDPALSRNESRLQQLAWQYAPADGDRFGPRQAAALRRGSEQQQHRGLGVGRRDHDLDNRTPAPGSVIPKFYDPKTNSSDATTAVTFDDARQKLFVFAGQSQWQGTSSNSVFWEWDPVSAGWAFRDSGDLIKYQLQFWRGLRQPTPSASVAHGGFDSVRQHVGPGHLGAGSQGADLVPAHFSRRLSRRGLLADGLRQQAWRDGAVLHARGRQYGRDRDLEYKVTNLGDWRGLYRCHGEDLRLGLLRGRRLLLKRGLFRDLPVMQRRRTRRYLHCGGCGAPKFLGAALDRRATAAAVARQRTARPVPARALAPRASAWMASVARMRAMAPACLATSPDVPASALPTPRAAIQRTNVLLALALAARLATAPAPVTIREPEHPAGPAVRAVMATACVWTLPMLLRAPPAELAAPAERVAGAALVARVDLAAQAGRAV